MSFVVRNQKWFGSDTLYAISACTTNRDVLIRLIAMFSSDSLMAFSNSRQTHKFSYFYKLNKNIYVDDLSLSVHFGVYNTVQMVAMGVAMNLRCQAL